MIELEKTFPAADATFNIGLNFNVFACPGLLLFEKV